MPKFIIFIFFTGIFTGQNIYAQNKLYPNTFHLSDVFLLDGPFKNARDLNINVLLKYNTKRLLNPYRKEAGLELVDSSFSNWSGLDGHIAGHYLSAMAMNYAATNNPECKERMEYILSELKQCQDANGKDSNFIGYLGGVPDGKSIWLKIKNGNPSAIWEGWVPWYNVHKMYAGLRDAWLYGENDTAKEMFLKFCDWAINLSAGLSDSQMQSMLDNEHGGMNEIMADAYQMTGDEKYLNAAKRFSHNALLKPLTEGIDNLDNKHANTQVPKAVGFQRIAEITNDENYIYASRFFWETVTANRSLAFGGNSRREHFPAVSSCSDFINDIEGPESCNSYNMLKLTEDLFRTNPLAEYMDYYERTLYNHILSTQHPVHGGYVYFTPARPRHYRVYSAPNEAMWCCVGSGMENHGKYNQLIYTHTNDSLFLNLFIASELNWRARKINIKQQTNFPDEGKTKLTITKGSAPFKLMIRYPSWVASGALKIFVNNKSISYSAEPASYVKIDRTWSAGDEIDIILPMHSTTEHMPNVPEYVAFMHGPVLLGAKTGTENLDGLIADDGRWSHIPVGDRLPIDKAPILIEDDISGMGAKIIPVKGKPLTFTFSQISMINPQDILLEPFYKIHDARYMIYWMALTNSQYKGHVDSIAAEEKKKLALQKRTVDFVATGEQQPEADHAMKSINSNTGVYLDEFWRDAKENGFFSYNLSTNNEKNLSLMVRYWGYEWGNRKFNIYIDDKNLISEDNTGKWYKTNFIDVIYPIPNSMVEGKEIIRVKFEALPNSTAGAIYHIGLLRENTHTTESD
jgi:hypothetical protein